MKHDLHVRSTRLFSICTWPFHMVVKCLAPTSLAFGCKRPVLSASFHRFSFCWFIIYTYLGLIRRRTFAMYTKFSG